jgi:hypothetical protein
MVRLIAGLIAFPRIRDARQQNKRTTPAKKGLNRMRLLLTFFLILIVRTARADELSAEDLYSFCTNKDQMVSNACRFYVLGVVQGVGIGDGSTMDASGNQMVGRKKTIFCIPDNMPQSQMVSLVRDMLGLDFKKYPEDKKLEAAGMVTGIMHTKFPCPK